MITASDLRMVQQKHQEQYDALKQRLSAVEAERDKLNGALDQYASVCVCGCAIGDHENYGEDGWCCEHDDHQCILTSKTVYAIVASLRAEQERMREALKGLLLRLANLPDDGDINEG